LAPVAEKEFQELVQRYRKAVKALAREFVAGALDDNRIASLVRNALGVLDDLDRGAARWALKNIGGAYGKVKRGTVDKIKAGNFSKCGPHGGDFRDVNRRAIDALILDPQVGFLANLRAATDDIRNRLKLIRSQARTLKDQDGSIDEAIARVGALRGGSVAEIKTAIVRELSARRNARQAVWRPRATALGPRHILANLANLTFIRIPTINGERFMRLDKYAELVARTKVSQAKAIAQRNALLEHGQCYVQVSRNLSSDVDACDLYVGRVFALTTDAAEELNVPHVEELPNGGTPFHPNCKHEELPFFPEAVSKQVLKRATTPPPTWALGRSWHDVQKEYEDRGGQKYGHQQNPNLRQAKEPKKRKASR
jgi:hypothetical protein